MLHPRPRVLATLLASTLLLAVPAYASEPDAEASEAAKTAPAAVDDAAAPWQQGVPQAQRDEAQRIFAEANARFGDKEYPTAVELYRRARAAWDHPSINYNLAVCLLELEQNVEAWEALRRALRFGQGPLSDRNFTEAKRYQRLVKKSLGFLRVRIDEPGAIVTLDGRALVTGPGEASRVLMPGPHQLVASKDGFVTLTRPTRVPGGDETVVELALEPVTEVVRVRRWPAWTPWAVLGGGALLAAAGAPLLVAAQGDYDEYDRYIASDCGGGCPPSALPGRVRDAETRGDAEKAGAIALFAIGGATMVAGAVLVVLNQPTEVRRPVVTVEPLGVGVAPVRGGGAMVTGAFAF